MDEDNRFGEAEFLNGTPLWWTNLTEFLDANFGTWLIADETANGRLMKKAMMIRCVRGRIIDDEFMLGKRRKSEGLFI